MKKEKLLPILCGALLVAALAFFGLWRQEAASRDDLYKLWDSAAIQAGQLLLEYEQTGSEALLAQAAAEMRVLERVAAMLPDQVDFAARNDLSAVCSILLLYPERGGDQGGPYNCAEWIVAVELMQNEGPETTGRNWPVKMNELRHLLEQGGK